MVGAKQESQENKTDLCVGLRRPWQFNVIILSNEREIVIVSKIEARKIRKKSRKEKK